MFETAQVLCITVILISDHTIILLVFKLERNALDGGEVPFFIDLGDIVEEAAGVGLVWVEDDFIRRTTLHKSALLHDVDTVGDVVG